MSQARVRCVIVDLAAGITTHYRTTQPGLGGLLPWADPYIARLVAALEQEGRDRPEPFSGPAETPARPPRAAASRRRGRTSP